MSLWRWSKTAASDATADPSINWAEGMAPSAVNDSGRAMMAAVAKWRDDITGILVPTGTGAAYSISSNQVITANTDGFTVQFTPNVTNTGAVTLSVDGQTAQPIRFYSGKDLPAGTLISGSLYQATYRAATSEWLLNSFDSSVYAVPIGSAIDYFGSTAPNSAFVLAYGQAISRTTYATLFTLFGTAYGAGDGTTTFNIPDLRGRIIAGADGMGGSLAGRLDATSGMNGTGIGAVGGSQTKALATANLPPQTPSGTVAASLTSLSLEMRSASSTGGNVANTVSQGNGGGTSVGAQNVQVDGQTISASFTGTAFPGQNATPFAVIQPTIVANKLLRII